SRSCLESGQILFIEDTAKAAVSINQRAICETESSAVILIPLHIENRCIGLMALSDSHPRRFTSAERRLAKLLGSQASVILANNRLYEQTRRDAQTKAVLLRELHHRVKNNLAGIVGLLSINEPVLSPVARQWLDRVIERILTMARTHDLFSSGVYRVGVQRLIEQLLPSVAALKPADVLIQRVGQDDGELSTPQAVSLAMVLHELCNNAIQHGLRNRGTLTIQTRLAAGRLRIDVMDDGCGLPTGLCHGDGDNSRLEVDLSTGTNNDEAFQSKGAIGVKVASAVQTHGLGLRLVRELVGRELHGTFQVCRRPEGGTIATIEFPLGAEVEGALP
ncbi:MAG TPA: ATP-binding protein, partial [Tepidisphaeraceae bacterium]|nr:ATP-binding protein [Tepidisphaeraceae bacterium]